MADRNPNMHDVAREAGVAQKTVSRFINGETNINPALAERIAAAIEKVGYRRNLAAASIRPGGSSKVLGLVIGEFDDPVYWTLARAIESYVRELGYLLIVASANSDHRSHDALVHRLLEQRVDGIIIVLPPDSVRPWMTGPSVPPLVFVDHPPENFPAADVVMADDYGGAVLGVAELIRNGSRRPAFVGASPAVHAIKERLRGYRAALAAAGLPPTDELVVFGRQSAADVSEAVRDLLGRSEPDAIFAANTRAAVGAFLAFTELDVRLPIVGFYDFESAPILSSPLSVVGTDIAEIGRSAAEILVRRVTGDGADRPQSRIVPPTLILRGSERRDSGSAA
jgi:LacI family transcriptional regulator